MSVLPRQKLSYAEKMRTDNTSNKNWGNSSVDYYIDQVDFTEKEEILSIYRGLEGEYDERDYNYVLNPMNTTVDRYKQFGAKLRNFDIINPVLKLHEGEYSERFKNITVLDSNPSDDNRYKDGLNKLVKNYYAQKTINDFNSLGLHTGHPDQDQGALDALINKYNEGFDSERVISGQEILDYIYYDQDLEEKHQEAYGHWIRAGRTFTYKGIFHNDLDFEVVAPWELTIPNNFKGNYIEDAPFAVRRQIMHPNAILDRWHDKLDDNAVNWLEAEAESGTNLQSGYVQLPSAYIKSKSDYKKYSILKQIDGIEVYHVQWKSYKKVGIVSFINELGQIDEKDVEDNYKLNKELGDITVKWEWISEVWEGWRVGEEHKGLYLDVRPLPYNRMELNNKSVQKLSYNGIVTKSVTGKVLSLASMGKSYQLIFNILHFQFEKTVNKNKGKIMVIPQGLIPKGVGGWDEEKTMYYADANGMLVVDETAPNAGFALQGIKILDMSLAGFAKDCIELMNAVKNEWWDASGMNRQRYGDIKTSDGKATSEQAIFRSAIISNELNRKFERFQEKDYAGLLDLSKLAYINGKKGKYINSDSREAFLKINPDNAVFHLESDYNIHVKNSKKENEKLAIAKEFGMSLAQNGQTTQMLELIDSTNFTKTKKVIKELEDITNRQEQAQAEQAQQSQEAIEAAKRETEQAKNDTAKYVSDNAYNAAIDVKILEIENSPQPDSNDTSDSETKRMNDHKIRVDNRKLELDAKEVGIKNKKVNADIKNKNNNNN